MSQDAPSANGSSNGGSNGNGDGGPPVGSIPDALLERMMDRKLRMLDLEYEECLKATKGYNIEDYDQGPVGDEEDELPAAAGTAGGYVPFGSMPLEGGGNDDEEWSEAWAEYKRECAAEAAEAAAAGITDADVANQTAPDPQPQKPEPLSEGTIAQIRGVMSGIKLKPPIWALGVPEEVWTAQLLSRLGMGGGARPQVAPVPAGAATLAATGATAAGPSVEQAAAAQKALERKRKKKQKAKRAAKAAAAAAAAADADFPVDFPTVDGAAVSAAQTTAVPAAAVEDSAALQTPD